MAQSLKRIRSRIRSVESIKKLTRAMEMVSVAKLNQIYKYIYYSKECLAKIESTVNNLVSSYSTIKNSFIEERENKRKVTICIITSDTGLCSTYNNNVIQRALEFIRGDNTEKDFVIIGKKGVSYFKKTGYKIVNTYINRFGKYSGEFSDTAAEYLIDLFSSQKTDEVYIAYTLFESATRYRAVAEKLLPVTVKPEKGIKTEYIAEPGIEIIMDEILPLYIKVKMRDVILNAFATEHSVRVNAMEEATKNAGDLVDELILLRNVIRQAGITTEITEVVSSVDALRG